MRMVSERGIADHPFEFIFYLGESIMKFLSRYIEMNGGGLMLMRRFCGIWFKYQPFENKLNKVEADMNKLAEQFEAKYEAHRKLMKQAREIHVEIQSARESEKAHGTPFIMSLPLFPFRHRATAKPEQTWKKFARVVDGKTATVAEQVASSGGFNIVGTSKGPNMYDPRDGDSDIIDTIVVGNKSMPIVPRRNNQKGGQQNNQQNQKQHNN